MRGSSPVGRWEVKDCAHFKAMSLCKQPVEKRKKTEHEERWPFHPCHLEWESKPGLASCFKVILRLLRHSLQCRRYFSLTMCLKTSFIPAPFFPEQCLAHSRCLITFAPFLCPSILYNIQIIVRKSNLSLVTLKFSS